jgi:importin subunit alpha-6/7
MSEANRYIPEHRRQQHKGRNQFRGDELRRRREDQQVEIRKQKKDENLAKRRNLEGRFHEWNNAAGVASDSDDENEAMNRTVRCTHSSSCGWDADKL